MTGPARSPRPHPGGALPAQRLAELDAEPVPARSLPASPATAAEARSAGWQLDDLWLPAVVLRDSALTHNLDRFARWCTEHGVELAPHGKTTMAPRLWSAQLAHGAWGLTAATVAQARVMRTCGVGRVLIANEVVEPAQLRWLADTLADPDFEPLCLVDSSDGLTVLERHLEPAERPLPVLLELGVAGRRTGVRGTAEALELAERIAGSPRLELAGIEGYEGALPQVRDGQAPEVARDWLARLTEFVVRADARGVFAANDEVLVTAGGSAYPDLVAGAFAAMPLLSRPVRFIVRSGCYLAHDDLLYERSSPLRSAADRDPLRPALSCFARVLSCPEPGRSLLGAGKRDVSFDIDLPVPRAMYREGVREPLDGRARIVELNDHHGFCDTEPGLLGVGDVVELGLSHPCTVFDKWQLIPVLDDADRVVDAVRTLF
ncbi:D-serine deaminase, pyridoxal phosphate-dependent [Haloechinothrix alba]|uniref:D-serine deaminase, pyridoxal phosphate-dependent n=1 Tax=Haloechinothrix alba TaxID=664784 RepID=A0A238WSI2_9PSEU|nr:alanine racemase [Haloechinothrix alba]SNR49204.1 D-serine deaminase, pyridoxal phosphate-dependent [Haloechinothrix alba]